MTARPCVLPRFLIALSFLLVMVPVGAGAQDRAGAGVSSVDSAAVLLETARAFEDGGQGTVARALYRHILDRFPGTPAAAVARAHLEEASGVAEMEEAEGSGAVELQVWSTLYGLWLGAAVPGALGADGTEPYGLGLLLGGPAGFITSRAVAGSTELTLGQARAVTLGGTWGTWQGFGWRTVLSIGVDEICPPGAGFCYQEEGVEENLAAMVVGGLAGVATGALLARGGVSSATATGANFGSLWGSWFGAAGGVLAGWSDDDVLASALVGGNAGLVGGAVATPRLGWSRDRWRVVSIAGVLGGLGGLGVDLLLQPDSEEAAVAIPLAGSLVGLGIGIRASRGMGPADVSDSRNDLGGALFSYGPGGVGLNTPIPFPVARSAPGPRGPEWKTALGFTLFQARF